MRSPAAFGAGKNPEAAGARALDHPVLDRPTLDRSAMVHPVSGHPAAGHPAVDHPTPDRPVRDHPAHDHPVLDHPALDRPVLDHLVLDPTVLDPGGRPSLFTPDDLRAALAALDPRSARRTSRVEGVTFDSSPIDPTEGILDFSDSEDRAGDLRSAAGMSAFADGPDRDDSRSPSAARLAHLGPRDPSPPATGFRHLARGIDPSTEGAVVALDSSVRLTWSDRARALHRDGPPGPRVLPVREDLAPLFPLGGLRRGGTVAVRDSAALLLTLLAEPTANGSWAAVIGVPDLGVLAAAELGVAVDRLALVPDPGNGIVTIAAALLDGFDVVALATPKITDAQARRLSARARSRGAALVAFGAWPGADLELRCTRARWSGLGDGHGHLRARLVEVHARGRGSAARPVRVRLNLQGTPFTPPSGPYPQLSKTG